MTTASPSRGYRTSKAIKSALLKRLGHQWGVGDRLPPLKQLAGQLGLGQTNTHHAVRELVAEGLLESRQRSGTYVVRLPDAPPDDDSTRGTLSGAVVTLLHNDPMPGFIRRMVDGFREVIGPTGAQIRFELAVDGSDDYQVDGDAVVMFNPNSDKINHLIRGPNQLLTVASTSALRLVVWTDRYDLVTVDELHGGGLAGRLLRSIGCRSACFLGRGTPPAYDRCDQTSALRLYGFEGGWGEHIDPGRIVLGQGYSAFSGGKLARRYMALHGDRPEGIFAASDDIAIGFVGAAAAAGLRPGEDYQLVGFDGQDIGGAVLTTVEAPASEMGRRAAQLLIERFATPHRPAQRVQLACTLRPGHTTRSSSIPSLQEISP